MNKPTAEFLERLAAWHSAAVERDATIQRFHADAARVIRDVTDEHAELLAALKEYVEWFGPVHGRACPADDTCTCIGGALNRRVGAAINKAEGR